MSTSFWLVLARLAGLVSFHQMFREGHAHRWANIRMEGMTADRTPLQVAIGNQTRLCCVPGAISDLLFPDLTGMVNRVFSLIVCGLSERISAMTFVFHCPSVRRSCNPVKVKQPTHLEVPTKTRADGTQEKRGYPQVQNLSPEFGVMSDRLPPIPHDGSRDFSGNISALSANSLSSSLIP